jgi:hypothetical protein
MFYVSAVIAGFMQSNGKKIKSIPSKMYRLWQIGGTHTRITPASGRGGGERISPNSTALDEVVLLQIKNNEPKFRS